MGTSAAATVAIVGLFKVKAAAGIVGPVVFTGAWIVSSLLQTGYSPADVQISGLAAPDAHDPWIMITGFLVLGGCTVAFGTALQEALAEPRGRVPEERPTDRQGRVSAETPTDRQGRVRGETAADRQGRVSAETAADRQGRVPGETPTGHADRASLAPRLIRGAGVLTIAAGLLRRDHMLLLPGAVSWHNHAHDVVSAVLYVDLVLAQFLLARRFGREPEWRPWRPWLLASAGVTSALLIAFAADTSAPWAGVLQRAAVTIPLAAITAISARLLRIPAPAG
jgi:hypothetical protein